MGTPRIAIIGAGLSGLACGLDLQAAGFTVTLFDKSRGPGGRACTRRTPHGRFDHGAQYFTATDPNFSRQVKEWAKLGWVKVWDARFGDHSDGRFTPQNPRRPRWVGSPRMSVLGRQLASTLDVRLQHKLTGLIPSTSRWRLSFEEGQPSNEYDWVVFTCPGPQTLSLMPEITALRASATTLQYQPCWALMLSFKDTLDAPLDAFKSDHPVIAWAARDSSKPGREPGERWVLHAQPNWSHEHLETSLDTINQLLIDAFQAILKQPISPTIASTHRWLYALSKKPDTRPTWIDEAAQLAICGDGTEGPRLESAWLSGSKMAEKLIDLFTANSSTQND